MVYSNLGKGRFAKAIYAAMLSLHSVAPISMEPHIPPSLKKILQWERMSDNPERRFVRECSKLDTKKAWDDYKNGDGKIYFIMMVYLGEIKTLTTFPEEIIKINFAEYAKLYGTLDEALKSEELNMLNNISEINRDKYPNFGVYILEADLRNSDFTGVYDKSGRKVADCEGPRRFDLIE